VSGSNNRTTADVVADAAVKLTIGALIIGSIKKALFGGGGRVDRIKFDYANTQVRKMPIGNGEFYEQPDPWTPNDLANRLHSAMLGVNMQDATIGDSRAEVWEEVSRLGIDRARWLHNYWLDVIDREDTLFRWISGEWANVPEWDAKDRALNMLRRASVGW